MEVEVSSIALVEDKKEVKEAKDTKEEKKEEVETETAAEEKAELENQEETQEQESADTEESIADRLAGLAGVGEKTAEEVLPELDACIQGLLDELNS